MRASALEGKSKSTLSLAFGKTACKDFRYNSVSSLRTTTKSTSVCLIHWMSEDAGKQQEDKVEGKIIHVSNPSMGFATICLYRIAVGFLGVVDMIEDYSNPPLSKGCNFQDPQ